MNARTLQATRTQQPLNPIGVDSALLSVFISLLMLGLVMVFSSTIAMGDQDLQTNTSYFWRQLLHLAIGVGITLV
ncbi:MAG: hypothetical protein HKN85_08340, partial [Gammaproteobacteria bacterium]|nr:hypothetical protein [Gammaproteobacteria bacterium]